MDPKIQAQLDEQGMKIDAIYESVEKTRKYFQLVMWISVAMVVLPLIALVFVVPFILNSYLSSLEGLL